MSNHEINLVTAQTVDFSQYLAFSKPIKTDWREIIHLGAVIFSFLAFIIVFWQLAKLEKGSYKSPFTRIINGAIMTVVSPISPQKAIEIKTILK